MNARSNVTAQVCTYTRAARVRAIIGSGEKDGGAVYAPLIPTTAAPMRHMPPT